ncbi:unnamed protein product [Prorocentrum cordatum]|uniref:Uncharacterized protein n=1 Tax=Prorocentrum cordatum TaxID=2364126 RepID=A0ABN9QDQ6_9DINO|nr:unnamed protein product [Polarella glacialis]
MARPQGGRGGGHEWAFALAAVADSGLLPSLSFGRQYLGFYCIALASTLWYKGLTFVYPTGAIVEEMVFLVSFYALQRMRLFFGLQGLKTQRKPMIVAFVWMAVPAACAIGYHINFQVYVLRLEVIACAISLFLLAVETTFGCMLGVFSADSLLEQCVLGLGFAMSLSAIIVMVALHTPRESDHRLV